MFNFLQRPFGLDISTQSIKVISLVGSEINPRLVAMGQAVLTQDTIEKGRVKDKQLLSKQITDLVADPDFGKIRNRYCIFSLPDYNIFTHFFQLPDNIKQEKKIEFIKKEISEVLPFELKDLYYDFIVYPEREVFLAACSKAIADEYLEALKLSKIKPMILDVGSRSQARTLLSKNNKLILILSIGSETTSVSLFDGQKSRLDTLVPVAGRNFTSAIAEKMNVSFAEAEIMKVETGLNPDTKEGRVFLILQQEIQLIIEEIQRINKYTLEKIGKTPEQIILTGGSAQIPFLSDYLSENLKIEVAIKDPWEKININLLRRKEYLEKASKINPILFANSIGLAQRALSKNILQSGINLIKKI